MLCATRKETFYYMKKNITISFHVMKCNEGKGKRCNQVLINRQKILKRLGVFGKYDETKTLREKP